MTDELRLRTRMIGAGVGLSVLLLLAVSVWIVETWQRPHRGGMVAMCVCAAVATAIIAAVPHERIALSRWREPFFLSWSVSLIAFITIAAGLDAGVRSPVVLMLFLTLVYAALSYPRWMVALVSAVSLCVSQARLQEEAQAELGRLSRSDPLTGCLNRLGFAERMAIELAAAHPEHSPVSLVVLDFDDFKIINGAVTRPVTSCCAGRRAP